MSVECLAWYLACQRSLGLHEVGLPHREPSVLTGEQSAGDPRHRRSVTSGLAFLTWLSPVLHSGLRSGRLSAHWLASFLIRLLFSKDSTCAHAQSRFSSSGHLRFKTSPLPSTFRKTEFLLLLPELIGND